MVYGTIIDYAREQLAQFDTVPFNDVDAAVLAQLSYAQLIEPFSTLLKTNTRRVQELEDAASQESSWSKFTRKLLHKPAPATQLSDSERFASLYDALYRAEDFETIFPSDANRAQMIELVQALIASPRYRDVKIGEFIYEFNEERYNDMQFAAMTFLLPTGEEYISFRGTEATFVGWREDFQLAYDDIIPSQTNAVRYVNTIASRSDHTLILGGHSKGGNTAVYAAVYCNADTRTRIKRVYTFDGPGFMTDILTTKEFKEIAPRLTKLVPQDSFIGMMFEGQEPYRVVRSSAVGINEHFIFTWDVDLDHSDFLHLDSLTQSAQNLSDAYIAWTNSLAKDKRRDIIDAMFEVAEASGYDNFSDLADNISTAGPKMWEKFRTMDESKRNALLVPFTDLFSKVFQFNWSTASVNPNTWDISALADRAVGQTLHQIADKITGVVSPSQTDSSSEDTDSNADHNE